MKRLLAISWEMPPLSGPRAVQVTVCDNGPGVPVIEREAIFRRLYRGDASRSQRGGLP